MFEGRSPGILARLDNDVFEALAGSATGSLDRSLALLSRSADHGVLWVLAAGVLAAAGGPAGRAAAPSGLGSTALTSLLVNQGLKRLVRRSRPPLGVPLARRVPMPATTSFPSGHAASAAAFATAASAELRVLRVPLGLVAAAVGLSRVYVGVHYPLDVVAGAAIGVAVGAAAPTAWRRARRARARLAKG